MMQWASLLLLLVALYTSVKSYELSKSRGRLKFLGFCIAAAIFACTQLGLIVEGFIASGDLTIYADTILEWGHILCLAFILSSLAVFVRQSKPVFAQFPLLYTALPLLIVVSYALVMNTYALKDWLISIYQGGAILVAILMYSVYTYRNGEYAIILTGTGFFLLTYLTYWYIPAVNDQFAWIWQTLLGVSMLTVIYGYDQLEQKGVGAELPQN